MQDIFFILISVLLIAVILLQQKSAGLGSMMGDAGDQMVQTRRGADRFLHRATIVLSVLFLLGGIGFMVLA